MESKNTARLIPCEVVGMMDAPEKPYYVYYCVQKADDVKNNANVFHGRATFVVCMKKCPENLISPLLTEVYVGHSFRYNRDYITKNRKEILE